MPCPLRPSRARHVQQSPEPTANPGCSWCRGYGHLVSSLTLITLCICLSSLTQLFTESFCKTLHCGTHIPFSKSLGLKSVQRMPLSRPCLTTPGCPLTPLTTQPCPVEDRPSLWTTCRGPLESSRQTAPLIVIPSCLYRSPPSLWVTTKVS